MAAGHVEGVWDPRFAPLVDAFRGSVTSGEERGGVAVLVDGEPVVEIWGGMADPATGSPWRRDTIACCFSVSKAVLSLLAHRMIDESLLGPDWPVARVWPEFAVNGKTAITILDVLTHRAGLPAVSSAVAPGDLYHWDPMVTALAASAPVVPERGDPVYHNMTYGHLIGEILRRAGGASVPDLLRDRLTGPLGADFRFALSGSDQSRAAHLTQHDPDSLFVALEAEPDTLFARSMRFFSPRESFNTPAWRGAVIGSGSGHATALGIATIFAQLLPGADYLSPARRIAATTERTRSAGDDPVMGIPIRYAEGFELSGPPALDFGPNPHAVGHWGAGGSTGFADPDKGLSFGYVTGNMAPGFGSSQRCRTLVAALYDCL